jgi:hypothetical protein
LFAFPLFLFWVYYQQRVTRGDSITWLRPKQWPRWLRTVLGVVAGGEIFSMLLIYTLLRDYHYTKAVYDQRQYLIVEGQVSHFDPMPKARHK